MATKSVKNFVKIDNYFFLSVYKRLQTALNIYYTTTTCTCPHLCINDYFDEHNSSFKPLKIISIMQSLNNSVQLIGHLGKEVDFKQLDSGKGLARVSIATNDISKKENGVTESSTQWHNIVGWGKTAELMQTLFKKGKKVAVKGKLVHRSYDGKDGLKRYVSEVVVYEFMLLN